MAEDAETLVGAGAQALEAGGWEQAARTFRAALDTAPTPDALAGLGEALWWLGDAKESVEYKQQAFAAYRHAGDIRRAAETALRLAVDHWASLGNAAASSGWLARAERLIDDHHLDGMQGWVRLLQAYDSHDASEGERLAREAYDLARRDGDLDLELCALSQVGATLVDQGRVADGVRYLDEAMAGSLGGEAGHPDTVVFTSCNTIISCTASAEFERAVQWVRATDLFTQRYGCPFLYAECRTLYGSVLVATGDWIQAEEELRAAIEVSRHAVPGLHDQALAALADLRVVQGRLEEAERLLSGLDGPVAVAVANARLHLARGRPAIAGSCARRALDEFGDDRLETVTVQELLGEALLAEHRVEEARTHGDALVQLGRRAGCAVAEARGHRLCGLVCGDAGDPAATHFEAALSIFSRLGMPFEVARTRLLLATALRADHVEVAIDEAKAALQVFEALEAAPGADAAAALLRELGVRAARAGRRNLGQLTKREQEVLALLAEGESNPQIAERLYLSRKTVEHHVASILSKLGLRNRAEAAAAAVRFGSDVVG